MGKMRALGRGTRQGEEGRAGVRWERQVPGESGRTSWLLHRQVMSGFL